MPNNCFHIKIPSMHPDRSHLPASFSYEALTLADIVVVDVQCDYTKESLGNVRQGRAEIKALEDSLKVIGDKI
jgi:hypothetical protein